MWRASCPEDRGLTLIEVMIASAIMGLVLLATYSALVLGLRYQKKQDDTVTVFQNAVIAGTKIQQSLANAATGSVVYDPDGLAFVSGLSQDGLFEHDETTGELKWQKFICFYRQNDALYQKEMYFPADTTLPPTPPVATMIADSSLPPRRIARNVNALNIILADSSVEFSLTVKSKLEAPNSVTIQNRVFLRQ